MTHWQINFCNSVNDKDEEKKKLLRYTQTQQEVGGNVDI